MSYAQVISRRREVFDVTKRPSGKDLIAIGFVGSLGLMVATSNVAGAAGADAVVCASPSPAPIARMPPATIILNILKVM
jgi:hypothetical protein